MTSEDAYFGIISAEKEVLKMPFLTGSFPQRSQKILIPFKPKGRLQNLLVFFYISVR
jgi:hypothetical protein